VPHSQTGTNWNGCRGLQPQWSLKSDLSLASPCSRDGRAVTVTELSVLSTRWESTDGTASYWKYIIGDFIVCRDVYGGLLSLERIRGRADDAATRLISNFHAINDVAAQVFMLVLID
jgi:hypothetical protein